MARLWAEVGHDRLTLRLEVHAAAAVSVPLPGDALRWVPELVLVDGEVAPALARSADGRLWAELGEGIHQVEVSGPLPDQAHVTVPLPLPPRQAALRSSWSLSCPGNR